MLEIDSIKWRNFLSYGDYETSLTKLSTLGPVLIYGETADGDSNGAGKSTITTAALWALFGRVFNKDKPGDNVINWDSDGGCFVEIRTVDGWIIRRTRKMKGHDDLLVYDSTGADQTRSTNAAAQKFINKKFGLDYYLFVASTFFGQLTKSFLETSDTVRKDVLERLLGLDRINAWAEVAKERLRSVESRQETLRAAIDALGKDTTKYQEMATASAAKTQEFERTKQAQLDDLSREVDEIHNAISIWDLETNLKLTKYQETHDKLVKLAAAKEKVLGDIAELRAQLIPLKRDTTSLATEAQKLAARRIELDGIKFADMRAQHASNSILITTHADLTSRINDLALQIRSKKQDATKAAKTIKDWADRSGTICPACQQAIGETHVSDLCRPYKDEAKALLAAVRQLEDDHAKLLAERTAIVIVNVPYSIVELNRLEAESKAIQDKASTYATQITHNESEIIRLSGQLEKLVAQEQKIQSAILSNKPPMSIADIESSRRANADNHKRLARLAADIRKQNALENPFLQLASDLKSKIEACAADVAKHQAELDGLSVNAVHYQYLWKSYSERSRVKRLILSKLIPYLNNRLRYYLDCFSCDIVLSFKDNLSIESNMWGYDYCSGGERKRIDLALMFALYDLYLGIHGRQCNVMVLDEVDGRLDGTGIDALIKIILNDFTKDQTGQPKPGTVFVISHRPEMVDAFPTKILVRRDENRKSHVVDVH